MARPTKHAPGDVARMVIDAAETIARREGLRGIGLRRIAAEVGYAPGSLYNLVGNLDEIVLRLNARTLERLAGFLRSRIDPAQPAVENAFRIADAYLEFVGAEPSLWGVILEHRMLPGTPFPAWYAQTLSRTTGLVDEVLRPLIAAEDERRLAVASLWAALHGIASLATSGKLAAVHDADARAVARNVVARFVAASPGEDRSARPGPTPPSKHRRLS